MCYVKSPFKVKKVISLLSTDLQVNQQLNLMNSETIKQLKPSCSIILGNFNLRSKLWWPDDIRPPEGTGIDSLQTIDGLH